MAFAPLKRFHYFFIACLAVKFFFVLFAFLKTITGPLDDAVVAATLLSYTYGFATAGMACGYRNRTPDSRGFCISGFAFFTGLLPAPWRKDQKPVHAAGNGMPGLVQYKILFGSPEPAVSRYIAEARHLGFAISDQFMAPLIYMRTGLPALFQMGFRSFQQPINWIYAILYLIQWGLLYSVYTTFRGQLLIENARSLLYSLLFIHLGALPLYLLATDYGRWSSFTFIMALLLIVRQVSFSAVFPARGIPGFTGRC